MTTCYVVTRKFTVYYYEIKLNTIYNFSLFYVIHFSMKFLTNEEKLEKPGLHFMEIKKKKKLRE